MKKFSINHCQWYICQKTNWIKWEYQDPFPKRMALQTSNRNTYIHIVSTYMKIRIRIYTKGFATCCIYTHNSHLYLDVDVCIYRTIFSCHITTIQTVNINDNVNLRNASTTANIAVWAIRNASLCVGIERLTRRISDKIL